MFKRYIISIICIFTLINCGYKRILKDEYGEPNLNEKVKYNFVERPNDKDFQKIDTTAYYVQVLKVDITMKEKKKIHK